MWSGRVTPGYVLTLVEHLLLNPYSRVRMIHLGGDPRFIGWDANAELAADRYDQMVAFAAGLGKKDPSPEQFYPRPGANRASEDSGELFAPTVDDFDPAAFLRVIAAG